MGWRDVVRSAGYLLAGLGILLATIPLTMIHEGPSRFTWAKVGLGMLLAALACVIATIRRGAGFDPRKPPTAYLLGIAAVAIPPAAFGMHTFQMAAIPVSFFVGLIGLTKAVIELTARKQWRLGRPWLALALCLAWPLALKVAPCFDRDPIKLSSRSADAPRCYEEMWGR